MELFPGSGNTHKHNKAVFRNVIICEYYEAKKNVKPEVGVKGRQGES